MNNCLYDCLISNYATFISNVSFHLYITIYIVCHLPKTSPHQLALKYDQFKVIISEMKGWSNRMEFNLSASPEDEPEYIDICTILKGDQPLQLPIHFNGISSQKN